MLLGGGGGSEDRLVYVVLQFFGEFRDGVNVMFTNDWMCCIIYVQPPRISLKCILSSIGFYVLFLFFRYTLQRSTRKNEKKERIDTYLEIISTFS